MLAALVALLVGAYVSYEVMHRRKHTHPGFGPYGRYTRRHHFYHHFVDPRTGDVRAEHAAYYELAWARTFTCSRWVV